MTNPFNINVNVSLSVSDETVSKLEGLLDHVTAAAVLLLKTSCAAAGESAETPENSPSGELADKTPAETAKPAKKAGKRAETKAPEAAPESRPEPAPAPLADDDIITVGSGEDDLPPDDAPAPAAAPAPEAPKAPAAPAREIANTELFAAVKDAQKRGAAAPAIREIFDEFSIASSRDCPPARRPELLARLNALNA